MAPIRALRLPAVLMLAANLQAVYAQRMANAPDCMVVSGGTGSAFGDPNIDGLWLTINRKITDLLFDDLRENGYAARNVFTDAADRDVKPNKALAAVGASGCAHLLQVSHQVGEDAGGRFFTFQVSLLRFVSDDGGPPTPGSSTRAVSDFTKEYRHPRTQEEMDRFHTGTFANEAFRDVVASHAIDHDFAPDPDATIVRQTYDRIAAANTGKEMHVRHLLVDDESKARAALGRIQRGEPFATVAHDVSIDLPSAAKGGDLEWAKPASYTPAFAHAVEALAPKGMTAEPVRSPFGWHVIEVLETRPAKFPSFDDVKVRIAATLKERHDEALKAASH